MITLRLFNVSDPFTEIDARRLADGEVVLGRGEEADWRLDDPTRRLSRRHCVVTVADGGVLLRDLSTNGVFVGTAKRRVEPEAALVLAFGEGFQLGDYIVVAERAEPGPADPPAQQLDAQPPPAPRSDVRADEGSLLEAFCAGARLDPSAFSTDDPAAVMRRLGAVYREMVAGLANLMDDRTSLKIEYSMDRPTIRPVDNNPVRWASADRISVDLLHDPMEGFLPGPRAIASAFSDVKKHLLCVFAGSKAAVEAVIEAFDPRAIEARAAAKSSFLQGPSAMAWKEYVALHGQTLSLNEEDGLAKREFRAGYLRALEELDGADEA